MKDTRFIDVRNKEEYEQQHIPGVQSIPVDELENRYSELDKDDRIVVVCNHGGRRSQKAADILQGNGFENVDIYEGGIVKWNEQNK